MPLTGQAAVITGGDGGFSRDIAECLAADGAALTLLGRTESSLAKVAHQLQETYPDTIAPRWVVGDATDRP